MKADSGVSGFSGDISGERGPEDKAKKLTQKLTQRRIP
jgi:hypothetical protein